jgi:molecular chaperone GrpE
MRYDEETEGRLSEDGETVEQSAGESGAAVGEAAAGGKKEETVSLPEYRELNDKYLRLYAEFDNYRKRVAKDKEDLVKYANESLLYEILPSIDHLDIALKHAGNEASQGLYTGVENTLRELQRTLEKFGLKHIEAVGKPFDPEFHHAMAQAERDDVDEGMVVEEFRKGYTYREKVLRAALVAVSKKPSPEMPETEDMSEEIELEEASGAEESEC